MPEPFDRLDPAALLGECTAAQAVARIGDVLAQASAEDEPRFREGVIASLEALFSNGSTDRSGWFEALLEVPLLRGDGDGTDAEGHAGGQLRGRLCRLLVDAIDAMEPGDRGERLETAARTLPDISMLCTVAMTIDATGDESYLGRFLPTLRKLLLDRILDLATTELLWAQESPGALLWYWFLYGDEQRVYLFAKQAMEDPASLSVLLTVPLEHTGSGEDLVAVRRWSRILDFQALESRAVALALSAPSRSDRRRARRFLDAFAAGKSDLYR